MSARRSAILAAWATLAGIVLSGPLALIGVKLTHPQPAWQSAEVFAEHLHPVQLFPYLGGLLLVGALVTLIASLHCLAERDQKPSTTAALVLTAAFAALITLNYVAQTTFVPALARNYDPANAAVLAAFTMTNPLSFAWGIEMWGWGLFGIATCLCAGVFRGAGVERAARLSFMANGPVSMAGALWTVLNPGWVMTPVGLVMFSLWNLLLAAMGVLTTIALARGTSYEPG